ncbi:hypothetical protein RHOSPDRAFT_36469 [Rhodotorula sp. JG-1b]|nr:hypothetical protein RHOSPDRAFT_36469 [Rhodotorula sp. JG-1b]
MTVNYTGGSRQAHRRVARKSQLDATGAPSYRIAAPSRSTALHLTSLRNTFKQPSGVKRPTSSAAAATSDMPRFNFSFAQQENVGQKQQRRRENAASAEEMMRNLYPDDAYDPNNPLERGTPLPAGHGRYRWLTYSLGCHPVAPPPPMTTSSATFSDQRRRVLAAGDWAGLGSSSNWKPARPAADLSLSGMATKRPRTRTPSPEYTPLTPPPRGGFLRGSSIDLASEEEDEDDDKSKAEEEERETTFGSGGDYSSEVEDAVILLPERGQAGATGLYRSEGGPGSVDPLAYLVNQGRGSLAPTDARKTTSIALQGAHFQWSARKRLAAATTTASRRNFGSPPPCLLPCRSQEPSASLAKVEETKEEEEQDLLRNLSGVRGLSLEDRSYEPSAASPSPTTEQPALHDSLELFVFSPHQSTADDDLGGALHVKEDEEQAVEPVIEKLAARSVDLQQPQEEPKKEMETVTGSASPTAEPAVEPPQTASASTAFHEYVALSPSPQDDFPSPLPSAAAATAEWDLEAMWRDMQGFLPAPPNLAPIHHLAHLRDEAFALHEPDKIATMPTFAALEGKVLLVSEQMGLGCEALTAQQADELVKREMAMRASGVMPIEWYSNEGEEECSDTEKKPGSQQLGRNGTGGQDDEENRDVDDDDEGWDPDAEDVGQQGAALPGRRILIPGLLFASDDDTGILEP